jgi:hypothetical protein
LGVTVGSESWVGGEGGIVMTSMHKIATTLTCQGARARRQNKFEAINDTECQCKLAFASPTVPVDLTLGKSTTLHCLSSVKGLMMSSTT